MDTLSELLADVRIRNAVFARTRMGARGQLEVREAAMPCFHLVTQGRVWLHPGDGSPAVPMTAGDMAFFPRGQAHRLSGQDQAEAQCSVDLSEWLTRPDGERAQILRVAGSHDTALGTEDIGRTVSGTLQISGVADAWLWGALPPHLLVQWGERALPTWLRIGLAYLDQELSREGLARQAVIDRLGDILFIQSLRSYLEVAGSRALGPHVTGPAPTAGWLAALKDGMVSRVLGAMHRDPARPWQLADLAREGCVSRSVLAERFADQVGQPPLTYLTRHRMQLAARRLRRSAASVTEVAASVGYRSGAAFAQAFRREFGCSPGEFRGRQQADTA
ncbi:MAG: AraC family transcriptional regulator [Rubrivivax sp.]|nr:MAG: AraC family transcriptional regulator [Rubrivivax sp.]